MATNGDPSTSTVTFNSFNRKIYVLSDLHLASGLNKNGNYDGTENFYYDSSFVRFIDHLQSQQNGTGILIINGDFIDFLRICDYPVGDVEMQAWQKILQQSGIQKSTEELKRSIVKKEREYGLKTNDYKSIWKLFICSKGHFALFKRLADWIKSGNDLVIIKGNHDLEWHWPAVQGYLRYRLAELGVAEDASLENVYLQTVSAHIHFVEDAMVIDNKYHIEHGHRYERTTAEVGEAVMGKSEELHLPFGSFFNRYLINRLEFAYPFLDNVRPSQNILPVLLRERFPLGVKVLFQYVPFALLIVPKKMYWYTFKYLLNILFVVVLPIAITAYAVYKQLQPEGLTPPSSPVMQQVFSVAKNFGFLFLSYIFGRILSMAGLKSPPTLSVHAEEIMKKNPSLQAVLFGHTHNPEQRNLGDKWYYNTGTWIPIFETSSADIRQDKTYTFITIDPTEAPPCRERLQRWNDDALRIDQMNLNDRK